MTTIIQSVCILFSAGEPKGERRVGASVMAFLNIFARKVVLETFIGDQGNSWLIANSARFPLKPAVILVVAAAGAAFIAATVWKGSTELRLFFLFVFLVYFAGLAWPPTLTFSNNTYWEIFATPSVGNRYLIGPIFAILLSFVWFAFSRRLLVRALATVGLLLVLVLGVRLDWREAAERLRL
jgi:hypothetical protein